MGLPGPRVDPRGQDGHPRNHIPTCEHIPAAWKHIPAAWKHVRSTPTLALWLAHVPALVHEPHGFPEHVAAAEEEVVIGRRIYAQSRFSSGVQGRADAEQDGARPF